MKKMQTLWPYWQFVSAGAGHYKEFRKIIMMIIEKKDIVKL
ncbi:MAG: hypothetical protein SO314_03775 [Alphaproteobacteria bacterium]|nr:hypothetical protein [Alphaproteobacteria bacterium]